MQKAAVDHISDIGPKGLVTTIGTDGSMPTDRIGKFGVIDETWAESNIFGAMNAIEVTERLIVCDGQPTRGFRKSLFNASLNYCGIAAGKHDSHDNMVQLEYVKAFLENGQTPSISIKISPEVSQALMK